MNKIVVFHAHNRFFVQVADGVREIPFSLINSWRNEGSEVEVKAVELYV
ncbi:hypothetical protein [Metabacillus sp. 84]